MNYSELKLQQIEASMDDLRRAIASARDRLREGLGLSRTQVEILFLLEERAQTTGDLAEHLSLTGGAVTQTIDTLVRRDLVFREPDDKDRRVVRLALTEAGEGLTRHLIDLKRRRLRALISSLSRQEIEALLVICNRLTEMFTDSEKELLAESKLTPTKRG